MKIRNIWDKQFIYWQILFPIGAPRTRCRLLLSTQTSHNNCGRKAHDCSPSRCSTIQLRDPSGYRPPIRMGLWFRFPGLQLHRYLVLQCVLWLLSSYFAFYNNDLNSKYFFWPSKKWTQFVFIVFSIKWSFISNRMLSTPAYLMLPGQSRLRLPTASMM